MVKRVRQKTPRRRSEHALGFTSVRGYVPPAVTLAGEGAPPKGTYRELRLDCRARAL